jgi:DNA-binding transcriptional regulator YiaG
MRWHPEPVEVRFWRKVDKSSDCWLWTGALDSAGYGQISVGTKAAGGRKLALTHRLSYEWHHGPIPEGLMVLHSCDIRRCVNPAHLSVGTHADNAADMVSRGRAAVGDQSSARLYPELRRRGVKHPKAKLSEDTVRAIRQQAATGMSQRQLAALYGVGKNTVQSVLEGKTWRHVV